MKLLWVLVLLVGATAVARADWKVNTEYVKGSATQIRVLSSGTHTVRVNGRTETTPAVFVVPNQDGYYTVEVTTAGGQRWSNKLEVRQGYETKLRIDWSSYASPAPQPSGRVRRIGALGNTTQNCSGGGYDVRFDVMEGNRTVLSRTVAKNSKAVNLEVPSGTYSVRVYKNQGGQFNYAETTSLRVDRDGWSLDHGCKQIQQYDGTIFYRCPTRTQYRVQIGKQSWDVNRNIPVRLPEGTYDYQIFLFDEGYWVPFKSGKVTAKPSWSISLC